MRYLSELEITTLKQQLCRCENWQNISVAENFSCENIHNVTFSGKVILGGNVKISNSEIANYTIKNGATIKNVNSLSVYGKSTFGNGTELSVLNEAGGREVKIFDKLSVHTAYILAMYRHRPQLIEQLNFLIDNYVSEQSSEIGTVGKNAQITNCRIIENVNIGDFAKVENVAELKNGTICEQVFVGTGVIARNFIIGKGSKVYDYALLEKCFLGESCEIGKQYSAIDSLIFCNSQLFHGEATAIFAGPYTISHHKSTLLIGCMFSFYNAGSGTNQSNHMYKLGPVHQGVLERGVKTGSDSYLMLAVKAGAFSLILGHHEQHFDTSDLPFSYILPENDKTALIPAVNFQTVGTQRDSQKWKKRDGRKDENLDFITFDLLNPYIIQKVKNGIAVLTKMSEKESTFHNYKNVRIKDVFVKKGIQIYRSAIICYLGEKLLGKLQTVGFDKEKLKPNTTIGNADWVDLSGLIAPKDLLDENLQYLENRQFASVEAVNALFSNIYDDYSHYEWNFVYHLFEETIGKTFEEIGKEDITEFLEEYKQSFLNFTNTILSDAEKEFNSASMVSFGADGDDKTKKADFENVRGSYENNSFVKEIIEKREKLLKNLDSIKF
jgi:carbonic anhydrase/acetyltransferase-like protein (isoleucine patch superfamily)